MPLKLREIMIEKDSIHFIAVLQGDSNDCMRMFKWKVKSVRIAKKIWICNWLVMIFQIPVVI